MSPRVSVIIPTYNNEAYVERDDASVLAQTFTDFELLVADHSSVDRPGSGSSSSPTTHGSG